MGLQVLVSTMNQENHSFIEKMNINSDAIIVNQHNENKIEEFKYKENNIRVLTLKERGVGLSRNTALMRAEADICLFADDDVKYIDNYEEIILDAFKNNPKADVLIFNVPSTNNERKSKLIKKNKRLYFHNCFKYGTYEVAVRLEAIRKANIHFSLLFGGGAKYSCGEDSLFLKDCLKHSLKIYSCTETIGQVSHQESTWFEGYTDKYFIDRGVLYGYLSKHCSILLCIQFVIRHGKMFKNSKNYKEILKLMIRGLRQI
ncbi:MAG: glycosyltransferase [Cellulosilyticaceae bacterium]